MKNSQSLRPAYLLALLAGCITFASAAPYGPNGRETRWTQPNGQVVQLRVFGDDYYGRAETTGGFTVVHNDEDETYYYAALSEDGKSLVPTATPADQPAPAGLVPHLDLPKGAIQEIVSANRAKFDTGRDERWRKRVDAVRDIRKGPGGAAARGAPAPGSKINAAPVIGDVRGLTIIVEFPNDPATAGSDPVSFPTTRDKIVRYCNTVGYKEDGNTGSIRDFFFDQSLGALNYTQTVTPVVTLPQPYNYYNYSDYPTNKVLYQDIGASASELIADAIQILQAQNFDFSSLTLDASNQALATNVFFAGPDSGTFARGLWPHQFTIQPTINVGTAGSPIIIANYQITNIPDAAPVIGTFCHENGHLILDYPDIYSLDGEGVGEHCLMGSGNYLDDGKTPSPINGYFKDLVGWGNVTDLAPSQFETANLPTTGNVAYRITNPDVATEFFMVENRGNGDKWAEFANDKGILIWHIDETINGNLRGGAHYGVALEQADGNSDLELGRNRGDAGDLFDIFDPKFTDSTTPSARWWDGSRSFVNVEVVSAVGASTKVSFGGVPPNTIIVSTPNGGEVLFKDSKYPVTWKANINGNVKIDLLKGGTFVTNIAANEDDDGSFEWSVPAKLVAANNYTVRISSVTNPIPTSDISDANFSVTDTTFPLDNVMPQGWFEPGFSASRWTVTKNFSFEGDYSLKSGVTPDGKRSAIAYQSLFKAGFVSFYIKVSSEDGFDVARFYIDDVPQPLSEGRSTKGLSGEVKWRFLKFPVSAGKHKFTWSFEKDDSYPGRQDAAWIDGVTLPATTQEIAIQQPVGKNLVSDASTITFTNTPINSSSKPKTFTITNRGRSDLTGLRVATSGENPTEFSAKDLSKAVLRPGASMTFEVVFLPKAFGPRTANLQVFSNDTNESPFVVALKGSGLGIPKIAVSVSGKTDRVLKDEDSYNFPITRIRGGKTVRTFTILNKGAAILNKLAVKKSGRHEDDFIIGSLGVLSLDPGDSTTFTVTFAPRGINLRTAELRILSNDTTSGPFDVTVSGSGAPAANGGSSSNLAGGLIQAVLGNDPRNSSSPAATFEVINGQKYLALSVNKLSDTPTGVVEVSPNLLDWYSGTSHTTVVSETRDSLRVRDNTPVTPEARRYIRLK